METKHETFIFCNDPICEADEAVDYMQATANFRDAKIDMLNKAIDFKNSTIIKLEDKIRKLESRIGFTKNGDR